MVILNGNYLSTLQYLYNNLATIDEQVYGSINILPSQLNLRHLFK